MSFISNIYTKYRVEAKISVSHLEAEAKRLLDRFFAEYHLPVPRLKVVGTIGEGWLGITLWSSKDPTNTTIKLQTRAVEDPKTLERILLHELIHHWDFLVNKPTDDEKKVRRQNSGHGKEFKKYAERINAVMGKNFITEVSDLSYDIESGTEYFLLVQPAEPFGYKKGTYSFSWAASPDKKQKAVINLRIAEQGARLFKSKDDAFVHGQKIGKFVGTSLDLKLQEKLKDIYEKGTQVQHAA